MLLLFIWQQKADFFRGDNPEGLDARNEVHVYMCAYWSVCSILMTHVLLCIMWCDWQRMILYDSSHVFKCIFTSYHGTKFELWCILSVLLLHSFFVRCYIHIHSILHIFMRCMSLHSMLGMFLLLLWSCLADAKCTIVYDPG